jgi:F-type H+-transporting ATPase subunit b
MRRTSLIFLAATVVLLMLLAPTLSLAETGGHGGDGEHHGINWGTLFWKTVNFIIFFGVLGYFLAKPIASFLRSRSENITNELNEARDARDQAQAELADARSKVANLEQELAEMRAKGGRNAEEMGRSMVAQAQAECERIEKQTAKDLDQMGKTARRQLREYAAELSIETAEKLVRESINDEDRGRILTASLERVGGEK